MTPRVVKNARRGDLLKLAKEGGSFRALRDPATGDIYAWPANDALHIDLVKAFGG